MAPTGTRELAHSLALLFRDCIENGEEGRGIIDAARLAYKLYDLSADRHPPPDPLSCKAGCSYCCHSFVAVTAPEAFLLAERFSEHVRDEGAMSVDEFLKRARPLAGMGPTARYDNELLPCPFLVDDKCSVYEVRPVVCRKTCSYSVQACIDGFNKVGGGTVPQDTARQTFGEGCSITLTAALRSLGFPWASYEMSEAVSVILRTEDALHRWTQGEDILAEVQSNVAVPAQLKTAIAEFSDAIS